MQSLKAAGAAAAIESERADAHATSRVPIVSRDLTVEQALERVLAGEWELAEQVWVVDAEGALGGVVDLVDLLRAEESERIARVCDPPPPAVSAETDQEHVALHAIRHRQHSVPVVDGEGRLCGVVIPGSLLRILRREHVEDLHRLAGIAREHPAHQESFDDPPARRAWHRLPWLLVGLAGSAVATATMSSYEGALAQHVALGFFVPAIVYLADAIGTQTEAIAVRGLSRAHVPLLRLVVPELGTGVFIGAVLATLSFAGVWLGFGSARLASAVGLAVLVSGALATTIGISLPWLLSRLGRDPALGSGPLATVIQDCLSVAVYLGIAARVVGPG